MLQSLPLYHQAWIGTVFSLNAIVCVEALANIWPIRIVSHYFRGDFEKNKQANSGVVKFLKLGFQKHCISDAFEF